jgi:hypothetical protein
MALSEGVDPEVEPTVGVVNRFGTDYPGKLIGKKRFPKEKRGRQREQRNIFDGCSVNRGFASWFFALQLGDLRRKWFASHSDIRHPILSISG